MLTAPQKAKKKMGRPSLGVDALLAIRVSPAMLAEREAWAADLQIRKSEAARQLLARGLKRK